MRAAIRKDIPIKNAPTRLQKHYTHVYDHGRKVVKIFSSKKGMMLSYTVEQTQTGILRSWLHINGPLVELADPAETTKGE